jgi:hypothetical protein
MLFLGLLVSDKAINAQNPVHITPSLILLSPAISVRLEVVEFSNFSFPLLLS